jgi:RimJ/RimL family protein N-acetyltransferase
VLTAPGSPEVVLDAPTEADADAITALCQDPGIQDWTTIPVPYSRADALHFVADAERGAADGSSLTWAIRVDGALVGMIGLERRPAASAELGYWLGPGARGRGLMARAVAAVVDHAFAPEPAGLGLDRLVWHAYVGNWPSRRVAERAGFTIEGAVREEGLQRGVRRDAWVGTLLRADWDAGWSRGSRWPGSWHVLMWRGLDAWRTEACEVLLSDGSEASPGGAPSGRRLLAHGTQLGVDPVPYRLDYRL